MKLSNTFLSIDGYAIALLYTSYWICTGHGDRF